MSKRAAPDDTHAVPAHWLKRLPKDATTIGSPFVPALGPATLSRQDLLLEREKSVQDILLSRTRPTEVENTAAQPPRKKPRRKKGLCLGRLTEHRTTPHRARDDIVRPDEKPADEAPQPLHHPHPALPAGLTNPDGPWGEYARNVTAECLADAWDGDAARLPALGSVLVRRGILAFRDFLPADERQFLRAIYARMAKARSLRTQLNGSKTYQFKFWRGLDYETLCDAPEVKLTPEERVRLARLRARVQAFAPLFDMFSRGFTHVPRRAKDEEWIASEAAFLASYGTSQGGHVDDIRWLFFNVMINMSECDTWSTWIIDYARYPNVKHHYMTNEVQMMRDYAQYMPQMLDQRTMIVLRVRIPPGGLWFFPSTLIHGGTGYNPRDAGGGEERVVLYQAVMTRAALVEFTSVRTTPYYRILLAKIYHKFNAQRAEFNAEGVQLTSSGRKEHDDKDALVAQEVARLCGEEPELVTVLRQWRNFSPTPARFAADARPEERYFVDDIAQALLDLKEGI